MLLNQVETALMNNPVRAAIQRHVEARWLRKLGGAVAGGRALEIGCGQGTGVEIILDHFGAARVDAFDLDPKMIRRAKQRLARRGDRVDLWVGDVTAIPAEADIYDAVFDVAIIHHVPDWRAALREVHRVLRPGGRFYAEEILAAFILNPVVRRVLEHPLIDRFDARAFREALEATGLRVAGERALGRYVAWFVADKGPQP